MSTLADRCYATLIDGGQIDWHALELKLGVGSPELAEIHRMARLFDAFSDTRTGQNKKELHCLFMWGHLRVTAPIGEGTFGRVYRAFDTILERDVALKLRRDAPLQARAFIAEARRLAQVRHPNVLAVHGAAVYEGQAGIWSDLIQGETLSERVGKHGPLPSDEIIAIAQALTAALRAVHEAGLLHGDVKPSNVMCETGSDRIVLMDFSSAGEQGFANRHGLLGSPATMAPEQLRGEAVSTAADLYGLGVILHFLTSGRYPKLPGAALRSGYAYADAPDESTKRPLRRLYPLRQLVRALLANAPEQRPDIRTISHRLDRIASAPARRRRRAGRLTTIAALSVGLSVALWQGQLAREQAISAERTRDFVVGLLGVAKPDGNPAGADMTVRDMIFSAIPRVETELTGAPESQAEIRTQLGSALFQLGDTDQALSLVLSSVDQLKSLTPDSAQLADALALQALVERRRGRTVSAETALRQAQSIAEKLPANEENRLRLIQLATTRFGLVFQEGQYLEAVQIAEQARDMRIRLLGSNDPGVAVDWNNVGAVLLALDRYAQAETAYRRALALLQSDPELSPVRQVWLRVGIGGALTGQGQYGAAQSELERSLDIALSMLGEKHALIGTILTGQARIHFYQDRHEEADRLFARAVDILDKQQHYTQGHVELRWGTALLAMERNERAASTLAKAIEHASTRLHADGPVVQSARAAHGLAIARLGQVDSGEKNVREALIRLEQLGLREHSHYAMAALYLTEILRLRGDWTHAAEWHDIGSRTLVAVLGKDHPRIELLHSGPYLP